MFEQNPKRGCGTKKYDACYAEADIFSEDGMLQPWTWLLGDGIKDNMYIQVPPRQVILINPVATITLKSLIGKDWPFEIPEESEPLYKRLSYVTKATGIADHVGDKFYSAFSFMAETLEYGPSRRISKDMAKELATIIWNEGPIPMLFTHNRIPVLRHEEDRVRLMSLVSDCFEEGKIDWEKSNWLIPTWWHKDWGMYRDNWVGNSHYLIPVLGCVDIIEKSWKTVRNEEPWQRLKDFMRDTEHIAFTEQPFGLSWLCKVTYTLDVDGLADATMLDVPGLNIINLDELEEQEVDNAKTESAPLGAD